MSDGIDLRFKRSNQTFGTSLSFENDILSLLNNRGDVLSSVNIDLIKKEELPTANEDNLGVIYLYTGPDDEYKHGYFYECVENSGVYSWENIVVQDSYLKSETYNKTETDTELAKKLNTDGSNIFTGVLKMRASISFKGAVAPSWSGIGFYKLNDDNSVSLMASMEEIDGFTPASNNTYNIGVNSRKWKDLYLAGKAYVPTINNGGNIAIPTSAGTMALTSDLTNFADKDLSNLTSQGKNIANWSSNISNCITEIPQDIKLELNNGTLTLKAGSKLYIPNGAGVFDEIIIDSDKSVEFQSWGSNTRMFFYNPTTDNFTGNILTYTTSGPSASPSNPTWVWYDTTNNLVKRTGNSGSTWESGWSFPICVCTNVQNTSSSIDQVFNGFGYIGSTVFALPGVKGLIPNGRNEDETLKNTEFIIDNVKTKTCNSGTKHIAVRGSSINNIAGYYQQETKPSENYSLWYKPSENLYYDTGTGTISQVNFIVAIKVICDINGKITSFNPNNTFYALDYNDTEYIGSQSKPSSTRQNLTLLASGQTYAMPVNGKLYFGKQATAVGQFVDMNNLTTGDRLQTQAVTNDAYCLQTIEVSKGDIVQINYNTAGTINGFYIIYDKGEI